MSSLPPWPNGPTDSAAPCSSGIRAAVEAIGILGAAMGTLWIAAAIPGWVRWEQTMLGGTWLVQILAFMVVPLVAVRLLGGRAGQLRSEERRVGKERSRRGTRVHEDKKEM